MDTDRYLKDVQEDYSLNAPLTREQAKDFESMLYSKPFKKVIFQIIELEVGTLSQIANAELVTDVGRNAAIRLQGKREGINAVLDALIEIPAEILEEIEDAREEKE